MKYPFLLVLCLWCSLLVVLCSAKNEWYEEDDFQFDLREAVDSGSGMSSNTPTTTSCKFDFDDIWNNSTLRVIVWPAAGVTVISLCCGLCGWCCFCYYVFCKNRSRNKKQTGIYTTKITEISPERNVELQSVLTETKRESKSKEKSVEREEEKPTELHIEKTKEEATKTEGATKTEEATISTEAKDKSSTNANVTTESGGEGAKTIAELVESKESSYTPTAPAEATAEDTQEDKKQEDLGTQDESKEEEKQEKEEGQQLTSVMTTDHPHEDKQVIIEQQQELDIDNILNAAVMDLSLTLQSFGVEGTNEIGKLIEDNQPPASNEETNLSDKKDHIISEVDSTPVVIEL